MSLSMGALTVCMLFWQANGAAFRRAVKGFQYELHHQNDGYPFMDYIKNLTTSCLPFPGGLAMAPHQLTVHAYGVDREMFIMDKMASGCTSSVYKGYFMDGPKKFVLWPNLYFHLENL